MKILEFVHGLKLDNIQTIRKDAIWFPFEEIFSLVSGDVGDRGEYICAVGCTAFDTVSVVDTAFPCLVVDVKVLEVVIKVDGTSAEVAAEEGGMGCKYGGDVDMSLPTERDGNTSLPLMKVGDNCGGKLAGNILQRG
jgi:hypothetical protein